MNNKIKVDVNSIYKILKYIENNEAQKELNLGKGRDLKTLIKDNEMPSFYKSLKEKVTTASMEQISFHVDVNGNRWNSNDYSLEAAIELSLSLVNCKNCVDCRDCVDCNNCTRCDGCENCSNCNDSDDCSDNDNLDNCTQNYKGKDI